MKGSYITASSGHFTNIDRCPQVQSKTFADPNARMAPCIIQNKNECEISVKNFNEGLPSFMMSTLINSFKKKNNIFIICMPLVWTCLKHMLHLL